MICKNCGFEYLDALKECPNCQAKNEALNTEVLTPEQRDHFEGVTINETLDSDSGARQSFKTEAEYHSQSNKKRTKTWSNVKSKTTGVPSLTFIILGLLVLGILFFVGVLIVPILLVLAAVSVVYFLINSLV